MCVVLPHVEAVIYRKSLIRRSCLLRHTCEMADDRGDDPQTLASPIRLAIYPHALMGLSSVVPQVVVATT